MLTDLLIISVKILYLISIVCDALSDAIIDKSHKRHHRYEDYQNIPLLLTMVAGFFFDSLWTVLFLLFSYIPLRAGLFNPIYSNNRGLGWYFIGTTNWYDIKIMRPLLEFEARRNIPVIKIYYIVCIISGLLIH